MHRGCQIIAASETPESSMDRVDAADRLLICAHRRATPHAGVRWCTGEWANPSEAPSAPGYSGETSMP
jgi:hypothetical protein